MKIIKYIILVLLTALVSCKQKSVKLPLINVSGIQDTIYNNTKIWMFYTLEDNDTIAELNKNNTISTTHWIFNIDKRLSLKHVIPDVKILQSKREKPSLHESEETAHNYYSFVDTSTKKLSLILFDDVQYITDKNISSNLINPYSIYKPIVIDYGKDKISIDKNITDINNIEDYITNKLDSTIIKVYLNLDKDLFYQDYINLKAVLQNIKNDSIIISNEEYIN